MKALNKIKTALKSLFYPSVNETLNEFQAKISHLNTRIDINVDIINFIDDEVKKLNAKKQLLTNQIDRAEKAVEQLEKIAQ